MDPGVVGEAAEQLAVTRVRKPLLVADVHKVVVCTIAIELSLLRNNIPHKRHKLLTTFFRCIQPKLFGEGSRVTYEIFGYQSLLRPIENFLPAVPIERDEDDVLGFVLAKRNRCVENDY